MTDHMIDIDEIIVNLKATITSNKGGVSLRNLESDYVAIMGDALPYRAMGYNSIEEFIESLKEFKIEKKNYTTMVSVVSGEKTKHLEEMIKRQKANKKSKYKKPKTFRRNPENKTEIKPSTYRKNPSTVNYRYSSTACSATSVDPRKLQYFNQLQQSMGSSEQSNSSIFELKLEKKSKQIITVNAIFSPSNVWVLLDGYSNNAVLVILDKLKSFNGLPFINDILEEKLLSKQFILIPNSVIKSPPIVNLYDTKTKMNINDLLVKAYYEKTTPTLVPRDGFSFVKANVFSFYNGYCYLLQNIDLLKSLENVLSSELFSKPCLKSVTDIHIGSVYLTTYKPNIKGRVIVNHCIDKTQVEIFFIDYGSCSIIDIKELIDLQKIDNLIAQIPSQVSKVTLHMFPPQDVTCEMVKMCFDILGNNTQVSVFPLNTFYRKEPCVQLLCNAYPFTYVNMILYTRLGKLKKHF